MSPLYGNISHQGSPCTPQDHVHHHSPNPGAFFETGTQQAAKPENNSTYFPATPTGPRDSSQQPGKQSFHLSGYHVPEVNQSLTSRFQRVELVATGEFSQVYRVSESQAFSTIPSFAGVSPPVPRERIWAVKKSKNPYSGLKDRERRVREVDILKALTGSEHVISFADSWEEKGHLYIRTEFCDEGSLDAFLARVGLKARLDDFRIWKILLELTLVGAPFCIIAETVLTGYRALNASTTWD